MKFIITILLLYCSLSWSDTKISDLPYLSESNWATDDLMMIIDVSALTGKSKKTTIADFDLRYSLPSQSGNFGKFLTTNGSTASWATVAGGGSGYQVSGSVGSPNVITASGGISHTSDMLSVYFVVSSGGAVSITANPQIDTGTSIGQNIIIFGTSDTDYPILNDGTGLALNGQMQLKNKSSIMLMWTGSEWWEVSRK